MIMQKYPIIVAIEGHSFAGKTTLLNYLVNNYPVSVVGEYDTFVKNTNEYPKFPHTTQEEALIDIDFFANLEKKRTNEILNKQVDKTLYIDRTFVSVVLFQKFVNLIKNEFEYDSYFYAKKKFLQLLNNNFSLIPDYIIILQTKNSFVHNSRLKRKISAEILRSDLAFRFFNKEFNHVFDAYKNASRILFLKSDNSTENLVGNAKKITCLNIKKLSYAEQEAIKKGLLNEL